MKMITIPTNQGTATPETALCQACDNLENRSYARDQAFSTDDIDPDADFVDCSDNDMIDCCICGKGIHN